MNQSLEFSLKEDVPLEFSDFRSFYSDLLSQISKLYSLEDPNDLTSFAKKLERYNQTAAKMNKKVNTHLMTAVKS